jgi:hypothetical protein
MARRRYKRKPYKPVSYDRFRETRLLAGMTRKQAAQLLFVTLRTIQLWERCAVKIPYAAFRLLRIHTGYEPPGRVFVCSVIPWLRQMEKMLLRLICATCR